VDDNTASRDPAKRPRNPKGAFLPQPDAAELKAEIIRLVGSGLSYRAIGDRLGVSHGYVGETWRAAVAEIRLDGAEDALRKEVERLEASGDRLEALEDQLRVTLGRKHYLVTPKGTVEDEQGNLIEDDDFLLRYADRVMRIEEQRGRNHDRMVKLRGLAQPAQQTMDMQVTYKIIGLGDDTEDAE